MTQTPASFASSKKCPQCAEMIQAAALKCRYCGTRLDVRPPTLRLVRRIGVAASAGVGGCWALAAVSTARSQLELAGVAILLLLAFSVVAWFGLLWYQRRWLFRGVAVGIIGFVIAVQLVLSSVPTPAAPTQAAVQIPQPAALPVEPETEGPVTVEPGQTVRYSTGGVNVFVTHKVVPAHPGR